MSKLDWTKANLPNYDPARVLDIGVGWARDDTVIKKRKKLSVKLRKKSRSRQMIGNVAPLIIPEAKAGLVGSIMRDIGKALPTKRNRLNNKLKELIVDGLISETGEIATDHPLMVKWLEVMESRTKRKV